MGIQQTVHSLKILESLEMLRISEVFVASSDRSFSEPPSGHGCPPVQVMDVRRNACFFFVQAWEGLTKAIAAGHPHE